MLFLQDPCIHVIIPPTSIVAPKPQPPAPLFVAPAPTGEMQPRFTVPLRSPDPVAAPRVAPAALSVGDDAASAFVVNPVASSNDGPSASAAAANMTALEAWALYYERVSFEWLQRWSFTREPQALASHELAAHYARGCRTCLSNKSSNHDSNLVSHHPSHVTHADAPPRVESSVRAAAAGTAVLAADQRHAAAPQVDVMHQADAAQAQAANFVDPAAPINAVAGGVGAGLLALVVRAVVTMCA